MTIFHHHCDFQPFEDDAGFPDPMGDRRALKEEVGRLRRLLHQTEDKLASVTAERDHLREQAGRRRWLSR